MTYKWAAAAFPRGGGKAVIDAPDGLSAEARDGLLRRYGSLVRELGGRFLTGPDVGTSPRDMDVISRDRDRRGCSAGPRRAAAREDPDGWTALGVFVSIETACERLFGSRALRGRRVVIQGAGSVGADLARRLADAGAEVEVADSDAAGRRASRRRSADPRRAGRGSPRPSVRRPLAVRAGRRARRRVHPDAARARAVVGAANNPLAKAEDAERLAGARNPLRAGLRRERRRRDRGDRHGGARLAGGARGGRRARHRGDALPRASRSDAEAITTDAAARRIAEERLGRPGR